MTGIVAAKGAGVLPPRTGAKGPATGLNDEPEAGKHHKRGYSATLNIGTPCPMLPYSDLRLKLCGCLCLYGSTASAAVGLRIMLLHSSG